MADDSSSKGAKPTIFIVDDSSTIRGHLSMVLGQAGRCVCFDNGEDAYKAALAEPPAIFVSDVLMEPIDGYELCRRVRTHPDLALCSFLMLTAADDISWCDMGLAGGADDFLGKPVRPPELLARVHSLNRLYVARRQLKEHSDAQKKLQEAIVAAEERWELAQRNLHHVRTQLSETQVALEKEAFAKAELQTKLTSAHGPSAAAVSDSAAGVDVPPSLVAAVTPPLDAVAQAIHQLMNAIQELEKPGADLRSRRALLSAARMGYASSLNELDRIRSLLHEGATPVVDPEVVKAHGPN